ncbi:MAG: inositol 2-dehydrogenase [Pseudomonadota bacterium]
MRVGLLGAGRIGNVHAQAISAHPKSDLVAVSDVREDNAIALAETYGCSAQPSEAILADPSIDAVLIATSTDSHARLIEAASAAGKAVLCEKPVDLSLERATACRNAVGARASQVMLGFNRRFDPNFSALKAALDAGEVGRAELVSITSFDPAPPPLEYIKVSGGLFRDMMIHDFDMANFLFGELPVRVFATGSSIVDPAIGAAGDVDTAVVTLTYSDGRIAVIKNSRRAVYGYDQRVELLGSKGLLQAQNMLENTVVMSTEAGVSSAKPQYFFLERYMSAYKAEWEAFVLAHANGARMPVSLEDGIAALAMAEAATQSAARGTPVDMAEVFRNSGCGEAA